MKIGIDARLINETGVGRYIHSLIQELGTTDSDNQYIIFLRKFAYDAFRLPNNRWEKRLAEVPWHSVKEQWVMPWILVRERLDLLHIPYFNVPIFYPGKYVVTIHDLTILHVDTGKATTLPIFFYKVRRLGYYLDLAVGLRRAQHILTVSKSTKQEIVDHFQLNPENITVTYEGVDEELKRNTHLKPQDRLVKESYFLYVGNAYPHKNVERLFYAIKLLENPIKLVLVGERDFFYQRLKRLADSLALKDRVIFFGIADNEQLRNLYTHATALVFPSAMEGFGLPGLEAMAKNIPVVCSDIPTFREIYGEAALYFNQYDEQDMKAKLHTIISDNKLRNSLVEKGKHITQRYSWKKMAQETLAVYMRSYR